MDEIKSADGQGGQVQAVKVRTKRETGIGQRFFFAVLVAIVAYGTYTAYQYFTKSADSPKVSSTSRSLFFNETYYAVFLDNNDVYFGKITKRDASFVTLENTFYLRVTQIQQRDEKGKIVDVPSLNLIKLGEELHKPTGEIELQINKIVSIQELDSASRVIQIINEYKAPSPEQAQQ